MKNSSYPVHTYFGIAESMMQFSLFNKLQLYLNFSIFFCNF